MKSLKKAILLASFAGGLVVSVDAQPAEPTPSPRSEQTNAPAPVPAQPGDQNGPGQPPTPDSPEAPGTPPGPDQNGGVPTPPDSAQPDATPNSSSNNSGPASAKARLQSPSSASQAGSSVALAPITNTVASFGDKGLRMNFRNVPLEMVLNYMSDAAGFIIVLETEVKGTVDVWSNQPLSKQESVTLLNTVLNKNGYAAIQDGRTLTIVSRDDARRRDIPIRSGNNPASIPKNTEVVTQIIPVRSLVASQLTKDLAPLLPTETTMTANEAGNSLIITDTQVNIHRMAEIIKALDSVSSSANSIRVFPLRFADAKALVTVVKELFPTQSTTGANQGGNFGRFNPMAMFGGGRGGNAAAGGDSSSQKPSTRVSAVSDDLSNSLIVSAPEDILPIVEDLVKSLDVSVEDVTELRVFRLQYADPAEMAELLTSLFPDDTTSSNNNNRGGQGQGPFGFFGRQGGNNNNSSSSQSDRMKRKGKVLAVADQRTASVVVSSDKTLMVQIAQMVEQLDSNPAKKQKVFVYSLQNADVQDVENILNDLFQSNNSRNTRSSSSQTSNPLSTRNQQMQSSSTSTSTFGNNSGGGRTAP